MNIDLTRVWYLEEQEAKAAREYLKNLDDRILRERLKDLSDREKNSVFKFKYQENWGECINFNMTFVEKLERDTGIRERVREITSWKSWRVYCIHYNKARFVYPPKYLHDLAHWCVATPRQIRQWYECQRNPDNNACDLDSIPTTSKSIDEELTVAWEITIKAKYKLTGLIKSSNSSIHHTTETARARLARLGINIDKSIYLPPYHFSRW
jgi:hypothetical protein